MKKINGFYKDEAIRFLQFLASGKKQGKSLSELFCEYAKISARAKGSVRNYYYGLLKTKNQDAEIDGLIKEFNFKAAPIVEFTNEQVDRLLESVINGKKQGKSVRSQIAQIAQGDPKLALRLQNKYRNILKQNPELIEQKLKNISISKTAASPMPNINDFALKRLQKEINLLYTKIGQSLRKENAALKEKLIALQGENLRLRIILERANYQEKNKSRIYFERGDNKHIIN